MPDSFCQANNDLLYIANGINSTLRYDAMLGLIDKAGVLGPAAAPVLGGAGHGQIFGTYNAFVRFVDRYENFSNLSPISNTYVTSGNTGAVGGATNANPIVIYSTAHGLADGDIVEVAGVGGNTAANGVWPIHVVDADHFSLDNTFGNDAYTSGGGWVSGVSTMVYSSLPVPTEGKVVRRQILRNAAGEGKTFYVDIDTPDLTSTTLTSDRLDVDLVTQPFQALVDNQGGSLNNLYTPPPNWKAVMCYHLDRMFYGVQIEYAEGAVRTFHGNTQVNGIGTEWTPEMAGRFLYVLGASKPYQIAAVNRLGQFLILTEPYLGPADPYASYSIRPPPPERKLVYYSEAGLPEAVPAVNAVGVQEDGDEITGLMAKGSFLYILERRHIYRFTFQSDPANDGSVFLACSRGCVNHKSWVQVEDTAYMLDEYGVHAFGADGDSKPISDQIQDLFRPDSEPDEYRVNWKARRWFHAVHYLPQNTIRFFVALQGEYLPRHALAYQYHRKQWWIEEFKVPIGSSCPGFIGTGRIPAVFLGSESRQVFNFWERYLDGINENEGTVRGTVTSAGLVSLTDSTARFAPAAVGCHVSITHGPAKGQTRLIVSLSATTLYLDQPWLHVPGPDDTYQVAGVIWRFHSGWFNFAETETDVDMRLEISFRTATREATLDARIPLDFEADAVLWTRDRDKKAGAGVEVNQGSTELVVYLTKLTGFAQKRWKYHREFASEDKHFARLEIGGVMNACPFAVYSVIIDGLVQQKQDGGS